MPVSSLYLSAHVATMELQEISDMIPDISSAIKNMPDDVKDTYKLAFQNTVSRIINRANQIGNFFSLSGAVESDAKNALLTPVISGSPVNPAAASNLTEQEALVVDGTTTNTNLQTLLDTINAVIE